MPYYVEVAWIKEGNHLTYITDTITELVGYIAAEVREMELLDLVTPSYAPAVLGLMNDGPNKIKPKTLPLALRHKAGHEVHCQATMICRYDGDGQLAETWGAIRHGPDQRQFNEVAQWWVEASAIAQQVLHDMLLLYAA